MFVAEIFESIHGEVNGHHQGRIVTFIRLSGCNLKCNYCDTAHTQDPLYGTNMSIDEIMRTVGSFGNRYICLTGGEPLMDKSNALELLNCLWSEGYKISVETNGTISITPFVRYVESFVIDYKMNIVPSDIKRCLSNFYVLRDSDVIKFVVKDKEDALQAFYVKNHMENEIPFVGNPLFAFSPIQPGLSAKELTDLLITNKVRNALISVQIHKMIGLK